MKCLAGTWEFELYVNDQTRRSAYAQENLRAFCRKYLGGNSRIEVLDLALHPELTMEKEIIVCPTLIIKHGKSEKTLVGDLSDTRSLQEYISHT